MILTEGNLKIFYSIFLLKPLFRIKRGAAEKKAKAACGRLIREINEHVMSMC